jgi:hypothetical protein
MVEALQRPAQLLLLVLLLEEVASRGDVTLTGDWKLGAPGMAMNDEQIQIRRLGINRDLSVIRHAQPGSATPATTILMRSAQWVAWL